ncbi:hypothetical protein [Hydrogenobacter hydrogenophilus]|uniref:Uncharacterized protein n=1 Tax=Hydrogenobacter hydrogenophilus TaxID=35835 RepID=A0A285NT76_9AQUI|nr:hypothetical protein [Hydrogenobacter hydrogenophilus]SNZ10871.1 hypothetical protein SAMN06265353_0077 [Hydrogenobacter hydrogenophilus]
MIKSLIVGALYVSFAVAYAEESHQHVPQSQQEQSISMMLMHKDAVRKALENNPQLKKQMEEVFR